MSQSQNNRSLTFQEMAYIQDYLQDFTKKNAVELSNQCKDMMEAKLEEAWREMEKRLDDKFNQLTELLRMIEEMSRKDEEILSLRWQLAQKQMQAEKDA